MVLGTYHFAVSEADAVDSQIGDVTTPERQAQVRRVVDSLIGFEPTAKPYRCNLRIFAKLTCVVEPDDRVLVIYGANHASYFREFIGDYPEMKFVDPLDYL
jgi:hypothetical protein